MVTEVGWGKSDRRAKMIRVHVWQGDTKCAVKRNKRGKDRKSVLKQRISHMLGSSQAEKEVAGAQQGATGRHTYLSCGVGGKQVKHNNNKIFPPEDSWERTVIE